MTTMDFSATLAALRRRRVETGSLVCFGCGHEHNCSTHGCAILRNAVEHMEAALSNYDSLSALVHRLETELKSEILSAAELRARLANEPLTLEELREMDGEPAWWDDGDGSCWGIISVDSAGMWGGIPFFRGRWKEVNFEYNIEDRKMKIYRRPPEGEEDA